MIQLKCKICGGNVIKTTDGYICDSCGTPVSVFDMDDDKKIESMNRANEARRTFDYDEAIRAYTQILAGDPNNAEAHWNLALSKFGIEYESEMTPSGRIQFKPNIHRLRNDSFDKDPNYRKAMLNADDNALTYYMSEGKVLSALQAKLMELVRTEKDYDVFISFKAEDGMGNRTRDSFIAQQIYEQLTSRGIRAFFSRITLQNVTGDEYEPHIFAALNSAKIMVLVGTDLSYINYGWVKNEWTRYLDLMDEDAGQGKTLIPVYETLPPEMFPKRIPMREAIDMAQKDAMLELIHGITNILGKQDSRQENAQADLLVGKAQTALDQGKFAEVISLASEATTLAPSHAEAWFLLFLAENRCKYAEDLLTKPVNWTESRYFDRAYEHSRGLRRQVLDDVKLAYMQEQERLRKDENARKQAELAEKSSKEAVSKARVAMKAGHFKEALSLLNDNVVASSEVNDLRTDCELGVQYENMNKTSYLYDKIKATNPKEIAELESAMTDNSEKSAILDRFFTFHEHFLRRKIAAIVMIVSFLFIWLNPLKELGNIIVAPFSIGGLLSFTYLIIVVANAFNAKHKTKSKFRWLIYLAVLFLIEILMEAAGNFGSLVVVVFGLLILEQAIKGERRDKASNAELHEKIHKAYAETERALINEYKTKFHILENYTELDSLTSVIDYITAQSMDKKGKLNGK